MYRAFIILFSTFFILPITALQTDSPITPSPAPTKTSTPIAEQDSNTEPLLSTPEITQKTFTQEDLSVITGNVQRPNGIAWLNDILYVSCSGDWTIYAIEAETGTTETYIYGVRNAHNLIAQEIDGATVLWAIDFDTNNLFKVEQTRSPQVVARELNRPWGITIFDENHFLITSLTGNSILKISQDGEVSTIIDELRSPTGIYADGNTIYFANSGSNRRGIEWIEIDEENNEGLEAQPLVSGIQNATNVTMGADEQLYFAYSLGTRGVVGRVDPDECREKGGCSNDEVEIILYTDLTAPLAGLTISPDMRLFVHTMFRPEIYWVQLPQPVDG